MLGIWKNRWDLMAADDEDRQEVLECVGIEDKIAEGGVSDITA